MPLFGGDDKKSGKRAEMRAELERLRGLSVAELAADIMHRGFGPDGPGSQTMSDNLAGASAEDLAKAYIPTEYGLEDELRAELYGLVAEGLQRLEHSSLVVLNLRAAGGGRTVFRYVPTRAGCAAIASGDIEQRLQPSAASH
jgi:hypothetical protein